MHSKLEPEMWPCDTGQWIPCFYRWDLTITGMSNNVKGHYKIKPRLNVCQPFSMSIATTLHDSIPPCIMYPQAILLATITKRKIEGFLFLYHTCMSARLHYLLCYWYRSFVTSHDLVSFYTLYPMICLHNAPVMACSNTFLEGSSAHGGTAVLFTTGGFPALKLRKEVNKNTDQNSYLFLHR